MATATIYSSTNDGQIYANDANYANARGATTGTLDNTSATFQLANEFVAAAFYVFHDFLFFDLSTINGTITAIDLVLTYNGTRDTTVDDSVQVVSSTASIPLVTGDFDLVGSTGFVTSPPAYSSFTTDTPKTLTINSTGIAAAQSAVGSTWKVALRALGDINNSSPGASRSFIQLYASEQTGTDYDPKITVTYTPAPSGGSTAYFM